MEQQSLKQYEGSVSIKDLFYALINARNMQPKTISYFWDSEISCHNCPYVTECEELTNILESKGKAPCCSDVIDILIGEQTVESFLSEEPKSETKYVIK